MRAWMIVRLGALAWLAASCGISGGGAGPQDEPKTGLQIQNVQVTATDTSAVVHWTTNDQTVGTLSWGRSQTTLTSTISSKLATDHSVNLDGLTPDTEYWYQITASSPLGPRSATTPVSFRTEVSSEIGDLTAPVISDIQVVGITSSAATITWKTDDRTVGQVYYGISPSYGQSQEEADPTAFTRVHALACSGLSEATLYHFRIAATNRAGLRTYSDDQTFSTVPLPYLEISPDTVNVSGSGDFTFAVSIRGVTNLAGISFMLAYDPQMIEIRNVQEGSFWWDHDGFVPLMLESEDVDLGRVQYAESWKITFVDNTAVGTLANGGGDVAVFTARTKGTVTSGLLRLIDTDENGDGNPETRLLDHNRLPMGFHVRNGWVIKQEK